MQLHPDAKSPEKRPTITKDQNKLRGRGACTCCGLLAPQLEIQRTVVAGSLQQNLKTGTGDQKLASSKVVARKDVTVGERGAGRGGL
jgi:hypothetical protein